MRKILLLSLLCAVIILSSCGDSEPVFAPGDVSIVSGNQSSPEQPDKAAITKEGERITITTLGKWNEFNHDGNFTDNCKIFLRMFI